MCVWCWHTIITLADNEEEARCPNCRSPFDLEAIRQQRPKQGKPPRKCIPQRQQYADLVLNDRRVVGVTNLPALLIENATIGSSPADVIQQHFVFGQYGRIHGVLLSKAQEGSWNAAVRFGSSEEAGHAVRYAHGAVLYGRTISCAPIPTRYCANFLMKVACTKRNCIELHSEVSERSFILKDASARTLPLMGVVPPAPEGMVDPHGQKLSMRQWVILRVEEYLAVSRHSVEQQLGMVATAEQGSPNDSSKHSSAIRRTVTGASLLYADLLRAEQWLKRFRNCEEFHTEEQLLDDLPPGVPPHIVGLALPRPSHARASP
jgi:hypothetical protein